MEKRTTNRLNKRLMVRFGRTKPDSLGITSDISDTGVFIKSNTVFSPGTDLVMDLTLPDERVIRLNGRVVWAKRVPPNMLRFVKKSGMGIFLDETPPDFFSILRKLEE
jgi:Tfp pilus assembly protein PilZ